MSVHIMVILIRQWTEISDIIPRFNAKEKCSVYTIGNFYRLLGQFAEIIIDFRELSKKKTVMT